jgi:ribosomal protein S18 acetylase RimI-like enzyme
VQPGLPTPLTDVSDRGLAAAIEADLVATRVLAPEVPVEVHDDADATWGVAHDEDPYRSIVASARFAAADADRRIAEILGTYAARGTGCMWWAAPFHTPLDLGARLARAGLQLEGRAPAMAMDLADLPRDEPLPEGLEIVGVTDAQLLEEFIRVHTTDPNPDDELVAPSSSMVDAIRLHLPSKLARERMPLRLVGRIDGQAVATARLSIGGGTAGLYTVLTLPGFRGRGIGRAMTLAALRTGQKLGYRIATLQSTEEGHRVYRRVGFRDVFAYEVYQRIEAPPAADRGS